MKSMRCQREHEQVHQVHHTTTIPAPAHHHPSPTAPIAVHVVEARSMRAPPARAAAATSTASWQEEGLLPLSATSG